MALYYDQLLTGNKSKEKVGSHRIFVNKISHKNKSADDTTTTIINYSASESSA